MNNRVKLLLSSLVVILSLNLFSIPSIAEASSLKPTPTLVEGKIEAVDAGEIEGIIEQNAEMVRLVTAYKQLTQTNTATGKITVSYYDYEYSSYLAGYTYTATEKWTDIGTIWEKMVGTGRQQVKVTYKAS